MIQNSIYAKICLNADILQLTEKRLAKIMPNKGNVRTLSITEKQYEKMKIFVGTKTYQENIITDKRYVEI